jgi:membrane protein
MAARIRCYKGAAVVHFVPDQGRLYAGVTLPPVGDRRKTVSQTASSGITGRSRQVWQVFKQSTSDMMIDNAMAWAAAVAFYGLFSIFPLLLIVAVIASYIVDANWAVDQATDLLESVAPIGAVEVGEIVRDAANVRGTIGILSFVTLLWSGTRVFGVLTMALNIAADADDNYGLIRRTIVEVVMLLTIGVGFILVLAAPYLISMAWTMLDILPGGQGVIGEVVSTVVPILLMVAAYFAIYRFVPRRRLRWRAALTGAVVATLIFAIARPIFLSYVESTMDEFHMIYGSLAIIIVFVFWAWIVALITLFGGEIAAHVQMMVIDGMSAEEVARRHQQRAPMRSPASSSPEVEPTQAVVRPGHGVEAVAAEPRRHRPSFMGGFAMMALLVCGAFLERWSSGRR